jgi:predicted dehydrogenase
MLNIGIAGLGWWGKTLVESMSGSEHGRIVAGADPAITPELKDFAGLHKMKLVSGVEELLADPNVHGVILATPHSMHHSHVVAAAKAKKHIFAEKPFALHKNEAVEMVAAAKKAGVTIALDYNRRLHPEMKKLKERINSGGLGTILHAESTMTFPNALYLKPGAWRADRNETPCGGLTPLGLHAIDGMIDFFGAIDTVYCLSFRRVVAVDSDDTTSMIFRFKNGMSGYLGTMTATGPGFSFQVYGSKGFVRLEGLTHVAGASSEERRTRLFAGCKFQPVKGEAENWTTPPFDLPRAAIEAFAIAAQGGEPYPIPTDQMIHGAAVTEAIVRSAEKGGSVEKVV